MKKISILFVVFFSIFAIQAQNKLTPELLWKLKRVSEHAISPDGQFVVYSVKEYDLSENKGVSQLYLSDTRGKKTIQLTKSPGSKYNIRWRPDGLKVGYISTETGSAEIWEVEDDGSEAVQISTFNSGLEGFEYSPDLKRILFVAPVRFEYPLNTTYPDLPKANAKVYDNLMYRHWDTWADGTRSHIFYMNYANEGLRDEPVDIMSDQPYDAPLKPFGGMEQIAWSPDGSKIAYTCKKLVGKEYAESTNSDIYVYDFETSKTRNLSEVLNGYDMEPSFNSDGTKIMWLSMETPGFEADRVRLYVYDFVANDRLDMTMNLDQSISSPIWAEDSKSVYCISGKNATYQVYNLNLETQALTQLTDGDHNYGSIALAKNKKRDILVASRQSMSAPTELYTIDLKKGDVEPLTRENEKLWSKVEKGRVEKRMIKTTDDKEMLTWVIYPPNFDSTKTYPTLLYCQGGPQSAVSQFFSYRWNFQLMAAQGYIVVAPNRRGLPTFGQEWNDQISGDWGGQAMNDYLSAIDEVSKETYVDENRLGSVGASYGGYSVYWLAGNHEGRFKSFISHCGLFNFESWYATTEELFFANHDIGGNWWSDKISDSYTKHSPHLYVKNWNTPIMVIHGEKDFRVPVSEGIQAFNTAQMLGVKSRFLYFPTEGHWVLNPQNGVLWHREFYRWLKETL
ncbi:MAG: dipeptidyl aminopeptidase/acylaminoacyl peptidase [Sphingobacteriales bacterium]|jgi:dipeptidyl aminopeptidase/acylaminoacyl peptidase